jgi:hypothetical protein
MKNHVTTAHQQHLFLNYADWRSYSKADSMWHPSSLCIYLQATNCSCSWF